MASSPLENADDIDYSNEEEIVEIISELASNKAPGEDGITNTMLKHLPKNFILHLLCIFNACSSPTFQQPGRGPW